MKEGRGLRELAPRDQNLRAQQAQSPGQIGVVRGRDPAERFVGPPQGSGRVAGSQRLLCPCECCVETSCPLETAGATEKQRQGDGGSVHSTRRTTQSEK